MLVCLAESLFGEQVLEVLILSLEGLVLRFYGGLLLFQFGDDPLEVIHLVTLLHTGSDCRFSVLKTLSGLFVIIWVLKVGVLSALVFNLLLQVLLLLFCESDEGWVRACVVVGVVSATLSPILSGTATLFFFDNFGAPTRVRLSTRM